MDELYLTDDANCSEFAPPVQLRKLSDLIITVQAYSGCVLTTDFSSKSDVEQAMRNASFWEFANLRGDINCLLTGNLLKFISLIEAFLTAAEEAMPTGSLDDFSKLANEIRGRWKKSRTQWEQHQIMKVASVYEILLHAPKEYLSKAQRASFFERGLVADMAIYLSARRNVGGDKQAFLRQRIIIRTWLGINGDSVDIVELAVFIISLSHIYILIHLLA